MTPDGKNDMILSVPAYLPGRYAGCADMAELADATVLGAVFERSAGSSPVIRSKRGKAESERFMLCPVFSISNAVISAVLKVQA